MNEANLMTNLIKNILKPWIPRNLITEEISGLYGNTLLQEFGEIIKYYNIYNYGAEFATTTNSDYIPSNIRYKKIKTLINKEARFMFSQSPDVVLTAIEQSEINNAKIDVFQNYIDEILKKNHFRGNIVKAAKDCFIGKRIAIFCNFDEESGIKISFVPSLEFIYEENGFGELQKIIVFFALNDAANTNDQRIQKKKYFIADDGFCHVSEAIYDGAGNIVEILIEDSATKFNYIPAAVIINDGLTGDTYGESEVATLFDYEQAFSKISNQDIDSERRSMNPIYYTKDMSSNSTKNLSLAPGAFWDLSTETGTADGLSGDVGVLETNLNYSDPLKTTLNRLEETMYEMIDMPNIDMESIKSIVTSGKALKAIYWPLIVRCNEKFLAWKPQLEFIIKCLIDGAFLYPEIAAKYSEQKLEYVDYTIDVNNQYPLPEDEESEKTVDLAEVAHQTMSKKSYMKKWRNLTDDDADAEIEQIAKERQILEESYFVTDNSQNEV